MIVSLLMLQVWGLQRSKDNRISQNQTQMYVIILGYIYSVFYKNGFITCCIHVDC